MQRLILIPLIIILVIGMFSFQGGERSNQLSLAVSEYMLTHYYANEVGDVISHADLQSFNGFIRRIAHFSMYAIFAFFLSVSLSKIIIGKAKRLSVVVVIGLLLAFLDETIQYFMPGRTSQLSDVITDLIGVIVGYMIAMLLLKVHKILRQFIA